MGFIIGKRIDSALRGNIETELRPLFKQAIVVTDAIPEHGRFTEVASLYFKKLQSRYN